MSSDANRARILTNIVYNFQRGISTNELMAAYSLWNPTDRNIGLNLTKYLDEDLVESTNKDGMITFYPAKKNTQQKDGIIGIIQNPFIEVGPSSPLYDMYPVEIFDAHSFSASFIDGDRIEEYLSKLHSDCEHTTLECVKPFIVNCGDCYVAKISDQWRRVKICSVCLDESSVVCYFVDYGFSTEINFNDLRIPPSNYVVDDGIYIIPKMFKRPGQIVQCSLDTDDKFPFPLSKKGLKYHLFGGSNLNTIQVKIRFTAYIHEWDSYIVDVFDKSGSENLVQKMNLSYSNSPTNMELDFHYSRNEEEDVV